MSVDREAPPQARSFAPDPEQTDARRLRSLLRMGGLSQRAAARLLNIEERTMRHWCAGQGRPPESVFRALSPRLTRTENLRRMIERNEEFIAALQDGRISGMGYGPDLSDPRSVAQEIERLRRENDEHRAIVRLEEAFHRRQEAYLELNPHWLPHGNGLPPGDSISEVEAAEAEFRAAQAEVARITEKHYGRRAAPSDNS